MILVLGSVIAVSSRFEEALALSQAHVRRAREVPGCLAHAVHLDSENPLRLVFVEQWEDQASIERHVNSPETRAFVASLTACASGGGRTEFYEAHRIARPARRER